MEDLKDTLRENADFYREQERKIAARLALLPKRRIRSKRIGKDVNYYLHYRKGRTVKTDYVGKEVPAELHAGLAERERLHAGFDIVGSWCFLLYQQCLPIDKHPLKTEDLDILIPRPFKGEAFNLNEFLQCLGFSQQFHPDGSMFFSGNRVKIEFLPRE